MLSMESWDMVPRVKANTKKVDILEGMHVISVACGMGHSMVIVDRPYVGDRFDQGLRYRMPKLQFLNKTTKKLLAKPPMAQRNQKIHLARRKKRIVILTVAAVENSLMVRFLSKAGLRAR